MSKKQKANESESSDTSEESDSNYSDAEPFPKKRRIETVSSDCDTSDNIDEEEENDEEREDNEEEENDDEEEPQPSTSRAANSEDLNENFMPIQTWFNGKISKFEINDLDEIDARDILKKFKTKLCNFIKKQVNIHRTVKLYLNLSGKFVKGKQRETKSFWSNIQQVDASDNLQELLDLLSEDLFKKSTDFEETGSGWSIVKFCNLKLIISEYNPLRGSSYIDLPTDIKSKKAVLNIKNLNDEKCFMWSILASLHPIPSRQQPHRISHYRNFQDELNFKGIEFPVQLKDIKKFEKLNNISVNVFGLSRRNKITGPLCHTKNKREKHVNLLLIEENNNKHYCLIREMSRLFGLQISRHKSRKYICDGCLLFFSTKEKFTKHQTEDCLHVETVLVSPDKMKLKFSNYERKLQVPFVVYADFESFSQPIEGSPSNQHIPYSYSFYIKCSFNDELSKLIHYRGKDAASHFVNNLEKEVEELCKQYMFKIKKMSPMTSSEKKKYEATDTCHICEKKFGTEGPDSDKVRDHCHLTGKFRGAAHSKCNMSYRLPTFIPVFFHNFTNYDSHLFVKELCTKNSNINVIAQSLERYVSISKRLRFEEKSITLRFLDSFKFMSSSLDELAKNLERHKYKALQKEFKYIENIEDFDEIYMKGVFPYEYITSLEKLEERTLPSKEEFFSSLSNSDISENDYNRAKKIWETFECKSLGEYSDVYNKLDVLLLADVFEEFREVCLKTYGLDPAQYYTSPGLSWDSMLKSTQIELDLLTDPSMVQFIKRGIRGGVSQCVKRKAIANNKYIDSFDKKQKSSFIVYLDATNLYGAAMSDYLPTKKFQWLSKQEVNEFDIQQISNDNNIGYILEVDLEYTEELHDLHNNLPFCPESIVSPASKIKMRKLIPNLNNKEKYVIHYRNLKQALQHGLKLKKIHRILSFEQSSWLKTYIDLNTRERQAARNKFEKNFYKLMNNSIFGKTIENVEKRQKVKIATSWINRRKSKGAVDLIASPFYIGHRIITENSILVHLKPNKVKYDKPIYLGFSILDISKTIIYDFYYNYIKNKYKDGENLLYTDTDSLLLELFTDDFYEDIKENLDKFDTSNFRPDNPYNIPINTSVLGKMKDEFAGDIITEFYGTGSKAYFIETTNENVFKKAAKGIPKGVKKDMKKKDYQNVIENDDVLYKDIHTISSKNHKVFTSKFSKKALSGWDDKRYRKPQNPDCDPDFGTLAWGHKDITQEDINQLKENIID